MEAKSVTGMIMGLFVAITVVAVIMVPTLNDAIGTEGVELQNEGIAFMQKYDDTAEITAVWDYNDPTHIVVNGETLTLPMGTDVYYTLFATSGGVTLVYHGDASWHYMFVYEQGTPGSQLTANTANDRAVLTFTISDGEITVTKNKSGTITTYSNTYTGDLYFIAPSGDYVLKDVTQSAHLLGSTEFFTVGAFKDLSTSTYTWYMIEGTIDDGFTASMYLYESTSEDHVINYTESEECSDVYEFTDVSCTLIKTSDSSEVAISAGLFIVPYTIAIEGHPGTLANFAGLLNILPLIVIAAIVLGSVALVATRRD